VTSASYAPATPYPAENGHDRSLPQPNAYSHSLYRPSGDRPHSQTHHPGIQAGMSSDDGVYHPAGPSTHTNPHSQHSAYHHAMPPPKPAVEAIPPPTPRVAYEPPVFRTFQERKRAKDMALRADSASNLGPSEAYRASTIPHSPQLPLLQHNVPRIPQANLSTSQTATRSVTLPPIPTNNRPLPLPSAPTPLSMLPSIRIPSPLTMTFPQNSPVYSPVQATIERSDTLSSIKSLDRMGFSSSGRRPLPKTPVGVNSSKSLDRGIPMTVASAGFRRKQPSVVSEESSEDGLADGMRSIELSPSPAESHISSRSTVSIVEPEARGSVPLPAIRSPDSDALQDVSPGEDGPSVRIVPPDRASSPAIAFTELPVIAVSSEHAGREIRNPMPSIALPGEPSTLAPSRIQPVGAIVCSGCGQPIIGRIVNAMRQRWHPQCFKCDACRDLLEHVSSYEYEGRAYCHLDYHDVSGSMSDCADVQRFAYRCHHCQTPIVDPRFVTLEDEVLGQRYYHELHFFCSECGDPFLDPSKSSAPGTEGTRGDDDETNAFVIHKGHPYCERCHLRLHKPKCKTCSKPIPDVAVNAMGARWHKECFICAVSEYDERS